MQKYQVIKHAGDGTYGSVFKAVNLFTNEIVAIKKMKIKYRTWEECLQLREIMFLQKLSHPNIVKLKEVILENGTLFLVFEYMECNLYQVIKEKSHLLTEERIRNWSYQVLSALNYMHQQGIFHRDLKPENLLVSGDVIKIADFGLARETQSRAPYTDYVATRWYRAPEVLMQATTYSYAIDIWAMGGIMAELYTSRPLFPGESEVDEIHIICSILGSPSYRSWPEGMQLANRKSFRFPQCQGINLQTLLPTASPAAVSLIYSMLSWDPLRRPAAMFLLQHPYFVYYSSPPVERSFIINIDPPEAGEYVRYNNPAGYNPPQQETNNIAVYKPIYNSLTAYKPPLQELNLFPSTTPQPAEAFSYGFPDVMRGQAQAQSQPVPMPPPCVTRPVPGLGISSKHIVCPNESYITTQQAPSAPLMKEFYPVYPNRRNLPV